MDQENRLLYVYNLIHSKDSIILIMLEMSMIIVYKQREKKLNKIKLKPLKIDIHNIIPNKKMQNCPLL